MNFFMRGTGITSDSEKNIALMMFMISIVIYSQTSGTIIVSPREKHLLAGRIFFCGFIG